MEEDTLLAESDGPRRPDGDEEEARPSASSEEMQRMC